MTNYSIVVSFTITLILVVIFADSSVHSYGIEFKGEGGAWHRHNSGYKRSRVRLIFITKVHCKLHITQGQIQYFCLLSRGVTNPKGDTNTIIRPKSLENEENWNGGVQNFTM